MLAISHELEEASTISGAGRLRTMGRVIVPLIYQYIGASLIMTFIYVFRDAATPLFLVSGKTMVLLLYILFSWINGSWMLASTMAVIQIILIVPLALLLNKYMRSAGIQA